MALRPTQPRHTSIQVNRFAGDFVVDVCAQNGAFPRRDAVDWASKSTYQGPCRARSGFPQEKSGETAAKLLQKESLLLVKGRTGMK